ncbi:hypothetical protein [Streptomyces poriferorum]|uniref:Uncharacterized protein n=1 Tax=Streptomyces poriferorum TaxID=2798799 RepID=A0ABY9IYA9_9ACTN|nr:MULTISPECIES: hypothetical protein [unclassified Streptomyces]MDP5311991.1 hypothetical protein [Streptomyces sp. Alt4]WLQ58948.1 hypothetical protein P8A19_27525 [Streptomyces sp. Alt2]
MSRRKNTQQKKTVHILTAYSAEIEEHRRKLKKRGFALAAEHTPPIGQAADWYWEARLHVPRSARDVARQLARLAGEGCEVTIPDASLADAVMVRDKAGRHVAYMEGGVKILEKSGWITKTVVGQKRGAKTTYTLEVGNRSGWFYREEDELEEADQECTE